MTTEAPAALDPAACHAALRARDPAADGRFFTCVTTTGIFCRPVCPARAPLPKNCCFVATAAEAVAAGFRACKRCRPDAVPGSAAWAGSGASVRRALGLIDSGALDNDGGVFGGAFDADDLDASGTGANGVDVSGLRNGEGKHGQRKPGVEALGDRLGLGERQVRRLFGKHLGSPPVAVAQAKRLAAANVLIDADRLPMSEVALAAGFGSVRRFNELYRAVHGETPASRRARIRQGATMILTLSRYAVPPAAGFNGGSSAISSNAAPSVAGFDGPSALDLDGPPTADFGGPLALDYGSGAPASDFGGGLLVVTEGDTLRALDFADFEARMRTLLGRHYGAVTLADGPVPPSIAAALDAYFAGDLTALDAVPVATGGSAFQRSVWAALRAIPPGTTTGYGALAALLGNPGAARAVGLANGANPIGIVVPCHRVIGANGTLTGYAGGVARKEWLLRHEGAISSLPFGKSKGPRLLEGGEARVGRRQVD